MQAREEIMTDMIKIEQHIERILKETFSRLYSCYPQIGKECLDNSNNTRLIFPPYGEDQNGEARVSEQELRFTFVEAFNNHCKKCEAAAEFRYSVETPTNGKYRFKNTDSPHIDNNGKSGNMDLVIHDKGGERLCLIEFKANNPEPKEIEKDLVKLTNCEECDRETGKPIPRYFIGMVKSTQPESTKKSIKDKIDKIRVKPKDDRNSEQVYIIFFNLDDNSILYEENFKFNNLSGENIPPQDPYTTWLNNIQQ